MLVDQNQRQLWWLPSAPVGRVIVEPCWTLLKWNKRWTAQQIWTIEVPDLASHEIHEIIAREYRRNKIKTQEKERKKEKISIATILGTLSEHGSMRTEGVLRRFIFWRGSGFLRCRSVKITMLELTLNSSGGRCWTVVMKKDAHKSTSVQTLWYMIFFKHIFIFLFFTTSTIFFLLVCVPEQKRFTAFSLCSLLLIILHIFSQTKATSVECVTI